MCAHACLVHIKVVCCNHFPRIDLLHLLQHLFLAPGIEAARGARLVAAGIAKDLLSARNQSGSKVASSFFSLRLLGGIPRKEIAGLSFSGTNLRRAHT